MKQSVKTCMIALFVFQKKFYEEKLSSFKAKTCLKLSLKIQVLIQGMNARLGISKN